MHIFIGGSGRSGTSLLMDCFNRIENVFVFTEPRFICDAKGIFDYVTGKCSPKEFKLNFAKVFHAIMLKNLYRTRWKLPDGEDHKKIWNSIYPESFVSSLLEKNIIGKDRYAEAKCFIDDLFQAAIQYLDCKWWAEKTPHTVRRCDLLYAIFKDMRYIHIFRDPRDVFSSVRGLPWGPNSPAEFVVWYNDLMTQSIKSSLEIPCENYYLLELVRLCENPVEVMTDLLQFSGIDVSQSEIERSASLIEVKRGRIGRHKSDLDQAENAIIKKYCFPIYEELLTMSRKT